MEKRVITLILESQNGTKTVNTDATTLGELKAALREAGIPYEGMTFREGLSRTELTDDASLLPKDVPYRGVITNNLVFTLATENKRIKSGAYSRTDVYAEIKKKNLQEAVKSAFGKNFTQVPTEGLVSFLNSHKEDKAAKTRTEAAPSPTSNIGEKFSRLVEILECNGTIKDYEAEELRSGILAPATPKASKPAEAVSPWSAEELARLKM